MCFNAFHLCIRSFIFKTCTFIFHVFYRESEPKIGDLMRTNAPFLKLYTDYVKNFDKAMNLINIWSEKSSKFAAIMQDIQVTKLFFMVIRLLFLICVIRV